MGHVVPHLKGLSFDQVSDLLPQNLILLGFRGSIAHGMYIPQSDPDSIDDKDLLGVFIGPQEHYIGFGRKDTFETTKNEWDMVSYEVVKFISLLEKANPNVLSILWLPEKHYVYRSLFGDKIIRDRELFVTRQAYHSFSGYAHGQLKRMTHFKFDGYMGEKRKALVEKYGYDCKNAAHLIRLLRMGIEFLTEGALVVERPDAEELLEIKRGIWSLEKVKFESNRLFKLAEEAYIRSPLPPHPDHKKIENLAMEIVKDYFRTMGWNGSGGIA